jgi:RimJ/RimL family protein N-acetyltransferase
VITAWNYDPLINKFFSPRPEFDENTQRKWFENLLSDPSKQKFMIIPNHQTRAVGTIGLQNISREHLRADLGITIGETRWQKKGVATESIRLLLGYAFSNLGLHQIRAEVFESNTAALRLFLKCGFHKNGKLRDQWKIGNKFESVILFNILSSEFIQHE